ncbi:pyridoxal phosphate-dependent transferase [Aspergillus venezuelensis]
MGSITPTSSKASNTLSQRGQNALDLGSKRITWDIISNITLVDYIHNNLEISAKHLTYNTGSMGSIALRKAVSHFLNRHFNPVHPVEPAHVLMTNGCSSAIEHLSWTFLNPGEAILLGKPYYATFIADICLRPEAVVVEVEMGAVDPLSPEAVSLYEQAAIKFEQRTGKRVRGLMLCNPHNPLGRCYPRDTITELMRLGQSRQMHLISDEIYALSVWENRADRDVGFTPFESLPARDTTGLIDPQLGNPEMHTAQKCLSLYSFVSGLSDQITTSILGNDAFTDAYIAANREKLSESHAFLVGLLKKQGIEYSRGCNAGFFLWVNLGKKYREARPDVQLEAQSLEFTDMLFQGLLDNKVYLAHGTAYGSENPGWFRLVFAHPLPWLEEAMRRILGAIL